MAYSEASKPTWHASSAPAPPATPDSPSTTSETTEDHDGVLIVNAEPSSPPAHERSPTTDHRGRHRQNSTALQRTMPAPPGPEHGFPLSALAFGPRAVLCDRAIRFRIAVE